MTICADYASLREAGLPASLFCFGNAWAYGWVVHVRIGWPGAARRPDVLYGGGPEISRELRVNHQIRIREVRVVGADGEQLGIMPTQDALRLAEQAELDLVEIAPQSRPPVCRLMDYGRFKYDQSKKEREHRKKSKSAVVKELRMSPKTDRHDFEVKVRSAERFLRDGDRVKVTVRFRGREIVHANLARERLSGIAESLAEVCMIDRPPFMEGRQMSIILAPKKAGAKDASSDSQASRSSQKEVVVSAQSQDA